MDNMQFAYILRELLDSRGISQKWLADEAGSTPATISRYTSGLNQPEINIVTKVARVLGVSLDYLFGLTDSPVVKETVGAELHLLMRCYERADSHDKRTVWTVLERYMTESEKERPFTSSYGREGSPRTG